MSVKPTRGLAAFLPVGLLLAARAVPVSPAPQTATLKVEVSLVTVGVRVTDAKGREVPILRPAISIVGLK